MSENSENKIIEQALEGRRNPNRKNFQESVKDPSSTIPRSQNYDYYKCKARVLAYVANIDSVSVIDILAGKEIKRIPVQSSPLDIKICPDKRYAYVTYPDIAAIGVISIADNKEIALINLNVPPFTAALTIGAAISPDGRFIYATNFGTLNISVVEITRNGWKVVAEIPLSKRPERIAITPDGRLAYVTLRDDSEIAVVNLLVNLPIKIIPAGTRPIDIEINKNYLGMAANPGSDDVTVFDAKLAEPSPTSIPVGDRPPGVAFTPNGKFAFVTNRSGGSVSVINVFLHKVIDTIPVGTQPIGVAVSEDGQFTAVANAESNSVSIIDNTRGQVVYTVPVGLEPFWLDIVTVKNNMNQIQRYKHH